MLNQTWLKKSVENLYIIVVMEVTTTKMKEELEVGEQIEFECYLDYREVKEEDNVCKTEWNQTLEVHDDKVHGKLDHQVAIVKEEKTLFNDLRTSERITSSSTDSASEDNMVIISPPKKRVKKMSLSSSEKHMVLNMYKTEVHLQPEKLLSDIVLETANCTGVSRSSVYRVMREYKNTHTLRSPKKEKRRKKLSESVDDFDRNSIRRKVHEFFFRNELPTIDKVLAAVNEDPDLGNFRRTTFYNLLKEMNFKYVRRGCDSMLIDKDDIILWRRRYLQTIKLFREEGRPIYYLDETWLNAGHTRSNTKLSNLSTRNKEPSPKGTCLIIAHVGSRTGFVEGCLWIFESKKGGDYHGEMCADTFEKWFKNVLPQLEENAVIVLDNASYHSRRKENVPNANSNKQDISEWLKSKHIAFHDSMLKKELLDVVKQHRVAYNAYVVDEMAKDMGKTVLRIPPNHCELNAIELVWARIKSYIAARNRSYMTSEVKELLKEAIRAVTTEDWEKCVLHVVERVESQMWKLDNIIEQREEQLIINVNEESSSS